MSEETATTWVARWWNQTMIAGLCLAMAACGLSSVGGDLPANTLADADAADSSDGTDATDGADTADVVPDGIDVADTADANAWDSDVNEPTDVGCWSNDGCDDGDACTQDTCDPTFGCKHAPTICEDTNACTSDTCDVKLGCQHTATACDDGDACTADSCDSQIGCQHEAISCDDDDKCTEDGCDVQLACQHTATDCGDGNKCTIDTCDAKVGCSHTLLPSDACNDNSACTTDSCDPVAGCQHAQVVCADDDACTLDNCLPASGCSYLPLEPTACSDGNACTVDNCVSATGCVSVPMAVTACDDNNACTADDCAPATGCTHLALDATPCDDGDVCTSADACAGTTCTGQISRWQKPFALPAGAGQWVGIAPRKDGSRLLVGWQVTLAVPLVYQMVTQRIDAQGQAIGAAQVVPGWNDLVVDHIAVHGGDVLVHGYRVENIQMTHPWYGLLDDNDQLFQAGDYEVPSADVSGGKPRAAFGKTITPASGTPFTRWYTAVDSPAINNVPRGAFYTIDPGSKPAHHTLGDANVNCGAVQIQDGLLLGTCVGAKSTDFFRAKFAESGKVLSVLRTAPLTATVFTATSAAIRPDGYVWHIGHSPAAPSAQILVALDPTGGLFKKLSLNLGDTMTLFDAIAEADGSFWLFGNDGTNAAMWRLDADGNVISSRTYGPGSWLRGMRDGDSLWLAGTSAVQTAAWPSFNANGIAARTDKWGIETCSGDAGCVLVTTCDDGNSCTNDWCDGMGCVHSNATLCNDGNGCTVLDYCTPNGVCNPGSPVVCDDGQTCTLDSCDANGCSFTPVADYSACNDSNSCTLFDRCVEGKCDFAYANPAGGGCGVAGVCVAGGMCATPWATDIVAGGQHSCAVNLDGRVHCWGTNTDYQLGNGDVDGAFFPLLVSNSIFWGPGKIVLGAGDHANVLWFGKWDETAAWGRSDKLQGDFTVTPPFVKYAMAVPIGLGSIAAIALGADHGCALETGGAVKCWGLSDFGQVSGVNTSGTAATTINGLGSVKAIAVGGNNSCAVQADGTVLCWGEMAGAWSTGNANGGASTSPLTVNKLSPTASLVLGKHHGCAILANGYPRCWGANDHKQLGNADVTAAFAGATLGGANNATQLAAGDDFTCALTMGPGDVVCWGAGGAGQMGDGTTSDRVFPLVVPGLDHIVKIAAHGQHACAVRFDGAVFCWGTGGIPGMASSTVPVPVPDSLP